MNNDKNQCELNLVPSSEIQAPFLLKDRLFWFTFLAGGVILSFTLWFDLGVDVCFYNYCAWIWDKYHLPPYIGFVDWDFPGIFILHLVAIKLFGEEELGFRIFDFLVQWSCVAMIFYLARRLTHNGVAGLFGGLFYSVYYYSIGKGYTGERDGFLAWIMLLIVVIWIGLGNRIYLRAMLTGALSGFAFLVKPTIGLLWVALGLWILVMGIKQKDSRRWRELFIYGFFCLVPSLLVILFYWERGYLKEMYEILALMIFKLYPQIPVTVKLAHEDPIKVSRSALIIYQLLIILNENPLILIGALIFILEYLYRQRRNSDRELFWLIVIMSLVGLSSIFIQHHSWPYHRIPLWAMIMILGGGGWVFILEKVRAGSQSLMSRGIRVGLSIVLLAIIITSIPPELQEFPFKYCFRSFKTSQRLSSNPVEQAADFIKSQLKPEDEIYFFGEFSKVRILFLIKRKLPVPYPFVYYLSLKLKDGSISKLQEYWIKDYVETFLRIKPRFFIFSTRPPSGLVGIKEPIIILKEDFSGVWQALNQNYKLVKKFGAIEIYEINTAQPSSPRQ